jgi:hypothetical protein
LSFLNIRVIVNHKEIYPLTSSKPVVIETTEDSTKISVTDGYHFTPEIQLDFKRPSFYKLKVVCAIHDDQLFLGLILLSLFYLLGFYTDILPFKILSFLPILYFLVLYYLNRKKFIQVKPMNR